MALVSNAVLTAAKGYVLRAPAETVALTPTEVAALAESETVPTAWELIGHTSRDDLPEFGFDGGDVETRGTWQNEALRTVQTEALTEFVTYNLVQFDESALELYYGQVNQADPSTGAGTYRLTSTGGKTTHALAIVIVDGEHGVACCVPRVDTRRNEAISLAVDEFGALPLRSDILKAETEGSYLTWVDGGVDGTPVINPA